MHCSNSIEWSSRPLMQNERGINWDRKFLLTSMHGSNLWHKHHRILDNGVNVCTGFTCLINGH